LTGKLLEEFNGALPPHIATKTAADTFVGQRFALVTEEHQRGGKVPTFQGGNHRDRVKTAETTPPRGFQLRPSAASTVE
jgi:hypothetical protein